MISAPSLRAQTFRGWQSDSHYVEFDLFDRFAYSKRQSEPVLSFVHCTVNNMFHRLTQRNSYHGKRTTPIQNVKKLCGSVKASFLGIHLVGDAGLVAGVHCTN